MTEAVTKFGGQPVWAGDARMAAQEVDRLPMPFIGQVAALSANRGRIRLRFAALFAQPG
jgi:hypothetical protein